MRPISSSHARSGAPPFARGVWQGAAAAILLTLLAGCAGGPGRPAPATVPDAPATDPAWVVPTSSFPTQRLYRLHYDSAQGEGALRVVLRLEDRERYRLTVADRLGRPLYTIEAAAGGGLLLDHREHLACPLAPDVRLEELPLDPLPLASLPAVLLGRVPAAPAGGAAVGTAESLRDGRSLSFRDAEGRRWTVELVRGWPVAWTLWDASEPRAWWRLAGDEAVFSDRDRGLQMSWRETGVEPLSEPLGPPTAPAGYAPGVCGAGDAGRFDSPAGAF